MYASGKVSSKMAVRSSDSFVRLSCAPYTYSSEQPASRQSFHTQSCISDHAAIDIIDTHTNAVRFIARNSSGDSVSRLRAIM